MSTPNISWATYLRRAVLHAADIEPHVHAAVEILCETFRSGGVLLVCGNGGSASDAGHMVGELVKSFRRRRPLPAQTADKLVKVGGVNTGADLAEHLEQGVRVLSLSAHAELCTAVANDIGADYVFAQQVGVWGRSGDCLVGISTSGRSRNVVLAAVTARAMGMQVIALTGPDAGDLRPFSDVCICAPGSETAVVQDAHRPIIHALCMAVEDALFADQ